MKLTDKKCSKGAMAFTFNKISARPQLRKMIMIMKLSVVLLFVSLQAFSHGFSQNISITEKNVKLNKVLEIIEKKTGLYFWYNQSLIENTKLVSISCKNTPWSDVLSMVLIPEGLNYKLENGTIVISEAQKTNATELFAANAFRKVVGVVKDANGVPLEGVSVKVKGQKTGAITDKEGKFSINANDGDVLEIIMIGYKMYTVKVTSANTELAIALQAEVSNLTDVVVVGYGTQSKAKITGAAATVKMDEVLGDRPVTSLGNVLQGTTPGLQISINSGQPGASTSWNIRGGTDFGSSLTSTINTQGPFILVDNVPYTGPTNLLDPNDIESVTVLKDAGSAAIYGARSAFGVVLITTKSGKKNQKAQFNYSNNFVFSNPINLPEKATPTDQVQAWLDGGMTVYNGNQNLSTWLQLLSDYKTNPQNYPNGYTVASGVYYQLAPTDAVHALLGNSAFQQMHNFSVSGGSDKTTYRLSFGTTNENGILVPQANQDNFKRYNIKSVVTSDVTNWLNLQLDAAYNNSTTLTPFYSNAFGDAVNLPSTLALDSIPGIAGTLATAKNEIMATAPKKTLYDDIRITGRAVAKVVKGLTVTAEYTIDNYHVQSSIYDKKVGGFLNPYGYTAQTIGSDNLTKTNGVTNLKMINIFGTYTKAFNKHNFTATAGFNQEESYAEADTIKASGMLNPNLPFIDGVTGLIPYQASDGYSEYSVRGVFGRLNYDYQNKYLFQINGRYDGSSKFPEDHRWGFFPSMSIGWRAMEENFMKFLKPTVNELKFRASYGTVGNQNISPYQFVPGMSVVIPNWLYNSVQVGSLNTPGLISTTFTWATVETKDLGVDFGILKNKLTGTFDWYQRDTKDILTSNASPVPAVLGTGAALQNAGSLRTKGFELQLSWKDKIGKVGYYITANLYNYVSTVTNVSNPQNVITNSSLYIGKKMGEIWGYTTDRFYTTDDFVAGTLNSNLRGGTLKPGVPKQNGQAPNPGDIMYKDFDSSGTITSGAGTLANSGDMRVIGNSTPQYQYGISGGVSYKNFEFSFLITGVGKQDQFINNTLTFPNQWLTYGALYAHQTNYWTPNNLNAFYGRIYTDNVNSPSQGFNQITQTRFLYNGAYTRIQNLTLRYSFPTAKLQNYHINKLQVFLSVENPYTFTHMPKGMYPDLAVQGSTAGGGLGYPYMRKTSFGLNVSF